MDVMHLSPAEYIDEARYGSRSTPVIYYCSGFGECEGYSSYFQTGELESRLTGGLRIDSRNCNAICNYINDVVAESNAARKAAEKLLTEANRNEDISYLALEAISFAFALIDHV
ncbi:hypothetical protein FGB62_41g22 [Gracilaria domingensis]|nr:hypothetical protein FGB62_41g22 [Gracilaria domingensis]